MARRQDLPRSIRRFLIDDGDDSAVGEGLDEDGRLLAPVPFKVETDEHSRQLANTRPVYSQDSNVGLQLIAADSRSCALPYTSTFEPLVVNSTSIPASPQTFLSHWRQLVPKERTELERLGSASRAHIVHGFHVQRCISDPLNAQLVELATAMEHAAAKQQFGDGPFGAHKSARGGFQSAPMLFQHSEVPDCDEEDVARPQLPPALHAVASAALNEIVAGESLASTHAQRHAGVAWLNVNRGSACNTTHVHNRDRWSCVYFVSAGGATDVDQLGCGHGTASTTGHLILRGGCQGSGATHTYLAIPPVPGTLWLFSGSIPHCVFPGAVHAGHQQPNPSANRHNSLELDKARGARISVAMNFDEEVKP